MMKILCRDSVSNKVANSWNIVVIYYRFAAKKINGLVFGFGYCWVNVRVEEVEDELN